MSKEELFVEIRDLLVGQIRNQKIDAEKLNSIVYLLSSDETKENYLKVLEVFASDIDGFKAILDIEAKAERLDFESTAAKVASRISKEDPILAGKFLSTVNENMVRNMAEAEYFVPNISKYLN